MYKILHQSLRKVFSHSFLFKFGFNFSPMYRRSTGRVTHVSSDSLQVDVKIPLSYKNRNYVGSIFGGSLFSATDPIYMIQLMQILGDDYIVWDRAASIRYRRPAKSNAFASFTFTNEEIEQLKKEVEEKGEVDLLKALNIVSASGEVFAEVNKTIYISSKAYYKEKRKKKMATAPVQ